MRNLVARHGPHGRYMHAPTVLQSSQEGLGPLKAVCYAHVALKNTMSHAVTASCWPQAKCITFWLTALHQVTEALARLQICVSGDSWNCADLTRRRFLAAGSQRFSQTATRYRSEASQDPGGAHQCRHSQRFLGRCRER